MGSWPRMYQFFALLVVSMTVIFAFALYRTPEAQLFKVLDMVFDLGGKLILAVGGGAGVKEIQKAVSRSSENKYINSKKEVTNDEAP